MKEDRLFSEKPKDQPNTKNASSKWGQAFRQFWAHVYNQGWIVNLCVGIALGLVFLAVPLLLKAQSNCPRDSFSSNHLAVGVRCPLVQVYR